MKKVPLPPGHIARILELDDGFEEFQREVRRAVENGGCYLVDESNFTEQAKLQALIKREWAKIDFSGMVVGEWDYDDPDCCEFL